MQQFTESDIERDHIYADRSELEYSPPEWMKRGLMETSSGYGKRLNSGYFIRFEGRRYRVYITCFSNVGTAWFQVKGRRIVVS